LNEGQSDQGIKESHLLLFHSHTLPNKRVFDVNVEGLSWEGIDIVRMGNNVAFTAITRVGAVICSDGFLTLKFLVRTPAVDLPKISAIEVNQYADVPAPVAPAPAPAKAPVPVPTKAVTKAPSLPGPTGKAPVVPTPVIPSFAPILVNCGSETNYTDSLGRTWMSDRYYTGGLIYSNAAAEVAGTIDDSLYTTERYGQSRYDIPVPSGKKA
jgi:Malectin domain